MSDSNTPAAPTRQQFKRLSEVKTIAEALQHPDLKTRMQAAIPKHMSVERMLRVCALAVQKTPKLAECDMMTLLGAMISLGSLGLEPNTPLGHAYLIPFEKRAKDGNGRWVSAGVEVQVIVGYRGYIDLARRSGSLVALHADVVYEGDEFSFEYGSNMHIMHRPRGARAGRKPVWAYFHAKLSDGEAFEVIPYEDVLAIRNASQGYVTALRNKAKYPDSFARNPWVAFEHEMAAKTMVRRIAKWLPMSIELADAGTMDASHEGGARVNYAAVAHADPGQAAAMRAITSDEYVPPFDLTGGFTNREVEVEGEAEPEPEQAPAPRQQQAVPAATPPRAQTQRQPPAAKATPAARREEPPPPPEPEPTPDFYLLDGDGTMTAGPFATGAAFVAAYLKLWHDTHDQEERDALAHHNDEFLALLSDADRNALAAGQGDTPPAAAPAGGQPITPKTASLPVPVRAGKPDWGAYTATAVAAVQKLESESALGAWLDANNETLAKAPPTTSKVVTATIGNLRKGWQAAAQPEPEDAADDGGFPGDDQFQPDDAGGPEPPETIPPEGAVDTVPAADRARANAMKEMVDAAEDQNALRSVSRSPAFATPLERFKVERPALAAEIEEYARARWAHLGAKP